MRLHLVAADFEENLGAGMIAAAAAQAGHRATVTSFNEPSEVEEVATRVLAARPDVVGLSIQFQHRAHEFLALARTLRARGFGGHLTCGGQWPTLAWREVVEGSHGVDSVVLHEGERTIVELLERLAGALPVDSVAGLALLGPDGLARRTAPRALLRDLDALPPAARYRPHSRHLGIPFVPIMGSRGCWGSCSYCSITSFYRDARAYGGGATLRLRSPENVAEEMAALWHRAKGPCIFCFHDDNFLLPRPADTLARVRAIRAALDARGVGKIAIIGKCRPDCVTEDLARELRALGVIRLYVGVENASQPGADHLGRGTQQKAIEQALTACRRAGIFVCYNLLLFEPDTTLDHVRENIAFMREHAAHPVNFCRAEPYYGTPLHHGLVARGELGGSYLGFDYRVADTRAELLFRVCAAAFRQRNFAPAGVANRMMGLGYTAKLLEHFYPEREAPRRRLLVRAGELTRAIATDTAERLADALELAETADLEDRDAVERATALLGLRIAATDRVFHTQLDAIHRDMQAFAAASVAARPQSQLAQSLRRLAQGVALGTSLTLFACDDDTVVDPVPSDAGMDAMVVDPPPPDAAMDVLVADPLPPDMAVIPPADPPPPDAGMVVDPPPPDMGMVVDPPPPDMGVIPPADPLPPDAGMSASPPEAANHASPRRLQLVDQWRDSAPRQAERSRDLPFHDPPVVSLEARREGERLHVRLRGAPPSVATRWESEGVVEGEGTEVAWTPRGEDDQLRVAVRTAGGVAVVALRACELTTA